MPQELVPKAQQNPTNLPFGRENPWLAPLAGYSDLPFRLLCRSYGCRCACTEMVSAKGLRYQSKGTFPLLASSPKDTPLVVQLFGATPEDLGYATDLLCDRGYTWFDLNIGCSVPKVLRQGAGAGMLKDTQNLLACAKTMLSIAGSGHVGFKLRSGLDSNQKIIPSLPLALEELGAGWITLHPRTAQQKFTGTADWSQLRELADRLKIPLIASGDLFTAEDGARCLNETHASTVMYARGAIHNPIIFSQHSAAIAGQEFLGSNSLLREMLFRYLDLVSSHCIQDQTHHMRGILASMVRGLPNARSIRIQLSHCTQWHNLYTIIDREIPERVDSGLL